MSAWECCGNYNEHALNCVTYLLPREEAKVQILEIELKRWKCLAESLGTRIEGHFLSCKDQENLRAGLNELKYLEDDR